MKFRLPKLAEAVKAQAQEDIMDLFAQDVAEKQAIHRAAIADSYGIKPKTDMEIGRPWKSITNHNRNESGIGGLIAIGLLTAVTGGIGGLGLGALGMQLLNRDKAQAEPAIHAGEYEIDLKAQDGKLIPTDVRPVPSK